MNFLIVVDYLLGAYLWFHTNVVLQVTIDGDKKDGSSGQYDSICNARLPKGLDPHSVPSDELSASLG